MDVIVDGIVLLHFIDTYLEAASEKKEEDDGRRKYIPMLVPDVLMLENQIPIEYSDARDDARFSN